jgi:hypothetical protein
MEKTLIKTIAFAFVAGAIGVLVFHQGLIWILNSAGVIPNSPYSLKPTAPFGVPQFLSLAFFGGIWGIAMILIMERFQRANRLWVAFLFGGIFPPLVGALVVAPLKGGNPADFLEWHHLVFGFFINAVWGLGTALAYRFERRLMA